MCFVSKVARWGGGMFQGLTWGFVILEIPMALVLGKLTKHGENLPFCDMKRFSSITCKTQNKSEKN